jgi:hypothetical protein
MLREPHRPRQGATARLVAIALAAAAALPSLAGCRERTPPIVVEDRMIKVENQTETRWTGVRIMLNDHFVSGTPVIEPGGRLHVQQRDFVTAFGQRFDPVRHGVYGVVLTARAGDEEIKLVWGQPYSR